MGLCAHIARMDACIIHMMRRTDRPRAHVVSVLPCFYVTRATGANRGYTSHALYTSKRARTGMMTEMGEKA